MYSSAQGAQMTIIRRLTPAALGLALVLHGLALTVLPLRGADAAVPGAWLPLVTAFWVLAVVGFVAAGLGVLGVRPLRGAIIPCALTAGVAALAAQELIGFVIARPTRRAWQSN